MTRLEFAAVLALTAATALSYALTKAPLYNPDRSIDPWLYTALWTNFHQIYATFHTTYYASRLPWIIPGYALNSVFDPRTSFLIWHAFVFFSAGAFLYLLCRRCFGWHAAAAAYIGLIGSQMFWDANRWDYWEGGIIAMLASSAYFATPTTTSRRLRLFSIAIAGGVMFAALTTLVVSVFYLVGPVILYAIIVAPRLRGRREIILDVGAALAGAVLVWIAFGTFALANGGSFSFFMPQIHAALGITSSTYHQSARTWLPREPRFWVPLAVILMGGVSLFARRRGSKGMSALGAGVLWTAASAFLIAVWEFGATGFGWEYTWYTSMFLVPTLFTVAGVVSTLTPSRLGTVGGSAVIAAAAAAVLVPLIGLYRRDDPSAAGNAANTTSLILLAVAVVAIAAFSRWRRSAAAIAALACGLALASTSYATDGSWGVFINGRSDPDSGARFELGMKMQTYLRRSLGTTTLPYFWFNGDDDYGTIQSLYFSSYTFLGMSMPMIDKDFDFRVSLFKPDRVVLLCRQVHCRGAIAALDRRGLRPRVLRSSLLRSGPLAMWVRIVALRPSSGASG